MIQNGVYTSRQMLSFSENHSKHTLKIKTSGARNDGSGVGAGTSCSFEARLNSKELKQLVEFMEANFSCHIEDSKWEAPRQ